MQAREAVQRKHSMQTRPSIKPNPFHRYELYISENEILIIKKTDTENLLIINRKSLTSRFIPFSELNSYKVEKPLSIYGIFGRVEINDITFIIAISKAKIVASLGKSEIFKIESIKFLTVNREHYKNFDYESCWDRLERIKNFLRTGFYFSYNYRLQSNFEGDFVFDSKTMMKDANTNPHIWNYKATRYLTFNHELKFERQNTNEKFSDTMRNSGEELDIDLRIGESTSAYNHFFFPVIQGFVGSFETKEFRIVLISRRSNIMGGTRYKSRGCDNSGNVANFVETEQIVLFKDTVYTFNQVRGSLPFYWEQPKGLINPKTVIHQRQEINLDLLQKHIKLTIDNQYSKLVFLNLLSNKKPEEDSLSRYLVNLIDAAINSNEFKNKIDYQHVDFHAITKHADFSNIDKHIYDISDLNGVVQNIFDYEVKNSRYITRSKQKVLIRTNCLDCLDRTNAVQTKFGFYALYKILVSINSELLGLFTESSNSGPLYTFEKGDDPFLKTIKKLWADNGDMISNIYTGTGATTSSVTRKGDSSKLASFFDHKMKTISRFYINNFDDEFKQEIIDILLHKKTTSIRENENLLRELRPELFNNIKVSFVTIFSCHNNGNVTISEQTLDSIFKNNKGTEVIIFITRMDKPKTIQLFSDKYFVCDSFNQLFKTLSKQLHGFKLIEQTEASKFELSIFASETNSSILSFFKSEKVNLSLMSPTIGLHTSFIINNNGIELFSVKLEKTTFGYSPADSLVRIFEKFIDKDYDLVLITGYIQDGDLQLETCNKNYELALQEVVKGSNDDKFSNHLILFCSKNLIKMERHPSSFPLYIDKSFLSEELSINARSILINKPK
jgi:hypothetical protein